jgi:hypothetical protein
MFERFMLPLKFRKMSLDRHIVHRFFSSDANAFRTFDWDIPNCRAIRDSVTPALNAARTAFNFPCVRGTSAISTSCRFSVTADRIFIKLGRTSSRLRKVFRSVSMPAAFRLVALSLRLLPHKSSSTRRH